MARKENKAARLSHNLLWCLADWMPNGMAIRQARRTEATTRMEVAPKPLRIIPVTASIVRYDSPKLPVSILPSQEKYCI
ncbi:hypothetical protein D3C73_1423290 [compost metagenome]